MTIWKSAKAIAQMTATGQSDVVATEEVDGVLRAQHLTAYIKHTNGTTVTGQATIVVQVQPADSSRWYDHATITGSSTSNETQTWTRSLPADAVNARLDYTEPAGSLGHTLDAEFGRAAT